MFNDAAFKYLSNNEYIFIKGSVLSSKAYMFFSYDGKHLIVNFLILIFLFIGVLGVVSILTFVILNKFRK